MSINVNSHVDVSADVSLRVPRGEAGTLESGLADVLANVDGVTAVTVERVTSIRPHWTDIRAEADVRLSVGVASDETDRAVAVQARLEDGFGVTGVNGVVVDDDA